MCKYYKLIKKFNIPLKIDSESDTFFSLKPNDIISVIFNNSGCIIKKLGNEYYEDSILTEDYILMHNKIFLDVTLEYKRDFKLNTLIKKLSN